MNRKPTPAEKKILRAVLCRCSGKKAPKSFKKVLKRLHKHYNVNLDYDYPWDEAIGFVILKDEEECWAYPMGSINSFVAEARADLMMKSDLEVEYYDNLGRRLLVRIDAITLTPISETAEEEV